MVLLNSDAFDDRALQKAGYPADPRGDHSMDAFNVYEVPMTSLTMEAVKPSGTKARDAERSKNFFALGLVSWMYSRPPEPTLDWISQALRRRRQGDGPGGQYPRLQGGVELR